MNKAACVGIAVVIIAAIIGVAYSISSSDTSVDNLPIIEEEIITEEAQSTDYSVGLSENIGLKTP